MADTKVEPPFPAYTGTEPFIFVSYSHEDATAVFPELKELHELGYRIWYDEGIEPGKHWLEEIDKALERSALFIVFISPNAVTSRHVTNEIGLALDLKKPFRAVHICQTELPRGLRMDLRSIQAVYKYQMSPHNYRRKLERALPDVVRDKAAQFAQDNSSLFPVEPQRSKPAIPTASALQSQRGGVLKRLKDAFAFEKPEAAASPPTPPATASQIVDHVADKTTALDHHLAGSASASGVPVREDERRRLGNGTEYGAESGSSLRPSPIRLGATTERRTAIHSQGLGTHPRKSWRMVAGSVVAAVCLLAAGIVFFLAWQSSPEPSARSARNARTGLLPEGSPPETQATTAPRVAVIDPPASTTNISPTPEVEASLQQPAEANPSARASIPDAEQPYEPAKSPQPEERTGPAKAKMAQAQAKGKFESVHTHSRPAMEKVVPPSDHCQTLLKRWQLGDPDSLKIYQSDCTH